MVDLAVLGLCLDSMILKVFSNLSDSMILYSTVPVMKSSGKPFCRMSPGPPSCSLALWQMVPTWWLRFGVPIPDTWFGATLLLPKQPVPS